MAVGVLFTVSCVAAAPDSGDDGGDADDDGAATTGPGTGDGATSTASSGGAGGAGSSAASGGGGGNVPCVPGAESLVCANANTVSLCTDDVDFDGTSDGEPETVQVNCADFMGGVDSASCETFDASTTEALCTMDDGGPCGVILVTGQVTTARCTTDDAVCMLDLGVANYVCTAGTGVQCAATGPSFQPFCYGDLAVWRCTDDGDGIG